MQLDRKNKTIMLFLILLPVIVAFSFLLYTVVSSKEDNVNKENKTEIASEANVKSESKTEINESTVSKENERTEMTSAESDVDNPYLDYIPVYYNGEEKNLYDLANENQFIFYLQRPTCPDCEKYGPTIIDILSDSGIAYAVIETSKEPQKLSGLAMEGKIAGEIGIKEIPALIFMKNGKAVEKFDSDVGDGSEIKNIINDLYKTNTK